MKGVANMCLNANESRSNIADMEPIASTEFAGGASRPVYEDERSQFVIDDDGNRVDGIWYVPASSATLRSRLATSSDCIAWVIGDETCPSRIGAYVVALNCRRAYPTYRTATNTNELPALNLKSPAW